ncbi:hypothetical protein RE428_48620 (plasmid) [Marinobacter nanhaiticus D15-8W]|uniref:Uncharacterized protein n=1 Tax=Marinobacter nanhaiticus D15-8W TaxID=626887 RepID=N6X106_9GAMM|nr:hypothetical protein [Marinobacter nanhaiticus]ENO17117.1 hypothetical protein J057_00589 [Marinobacter nanhaiticus D15-8W]BES73844.1 hypothetical protein RE428_48620 [Marinobacter nanhaiticus D15-8W]
MTVEKRPVEEVIKELGLPPESKFLGYVIHLPNEDEFLGFIKETSAAVKRGFVKTPQAAKVYHSYKRALRDAGKCKQKAEPNLLFDIGTQFAAVPVD